MGSEDVQEDVNMAGESEVQKEESKGKGDEDGEELEEDNGGHADGNMAKTIGDEEEEEEDSASDDSDSDSDDGEDLEIAKQVADLEESLAADMYNYAVRAQLIATLRKAGNLEKLRAAREAMNLLYPLTPDMWRGWAQDEARLASGEQDVLAVVALYERGIQEYLSVTLWLEYLKFVEENDASVAEGTKEGVSKMRNLYERALGAVSLHYAEGWKVWEGYREFEQALLLLLNVPAEEGKVKQVENIRNLFWRQLKIPSRNLVETLEEYKEWEDQQGNHIGDENDELAGLPSHVCLAYKKAFQLCSIREIHEEKIAKAKPGDAEQLQHYMGYINVEEASGEPARAVVLYERAVSAFPVSQELWMKYTQYLETSLKVGLVLKGAYTRAVRNCPWVEPLWKSYLLALERFGAPESELSAVFEHSLHGGFQSSQEYLDLFLTRCDGLRRRVMATAEGPNRQSDIALLHATFDRTSQFLATYYPDFVDRTLQLHAYWADIEVHIAKDLVAARGVWEGLLKSSGWMTEVWQAYISMEISLKNIKEARAIYRTCYSRRLEGNGTELMCSAWLRFEREHGTLEDYDRAVLKVGPRLAEVQAMQFQQDIKSVQNFVDPRSVRGSTEGKNKAKKQIGKSAQENTSDSAMGKRKRVLGSNEFKPKLKRPKVDKQLALKQPKAGKGKEIQKAAMKVSNSDPNHGETKLSAGTSDGDVAMDGDSPQKTSQRPQLPKREYTDECTAFVSNIPFEVTVEQLTEFFSSVAGVKEVRMLKQKATGIPRMEKRVGTVLELLNGGPVTALQNLVSFILQGLAYVDFEDEESLAAAVTKNKQELIGRPLTVARSAPQRGRGRGGDHSHRGGRHSSGRGAENQGERYSGQARGGVGFLGHRRGGKVSMTGNNTFAVPRAVVRPLGWNPGQAATAGDEVPKSNDEFRKILLSKK